jgi:hypothetical protein
MRTTPSHPGMRAPLCVWLPYHCRTTAAWTAGGHAHGCPLTPLPGFAGETDNALWQSTASSSDVLLMLPAH